MKVFKIAILVLAEIDKPAYLLGRLLIPSA